ncbi:hypothetical protein [Undibacterium flavidum]|uniref:Uncharacterized protein n=1 Tax=Undibacterium flavidum TaxID=2762297 RepID=A0ABR6YBF5_9BURK|nr:hypothetical protein [Undibacterium flavidum]MBC3873971.1 hypothetical protein [Undibacterium flavidum]
MKAISPPSISKALFAALLTSLMISSAIAAEATPAETKTRMIRLINQLETDPFLKDGKSVRSEVLSWLTEAPDVSVNVCTNVLGDISKIKGDDGGTLLVQLMFSEAKFILEHPDKATDQHAINVAGIEGVLRTYASMQRSKPTLTIREFDQLTQMKTSGQLGAEVEKRLTECK